MNEDFLSCIWQFRLFDAQNLKTTDGELLEIISPGELNKDGGPDFQNAKIKIGDTLWVGNIEIHVNGSDWLKHGHQRDKAYNNVVLHVVFNHDKKIRIREEEELKTLELKFRMHTHSILKYEQLSKATGKLACKSSIASIEFLKLNQWLERMAFERLEYKSTQISAFFKESNLNLEETFMKVIFQSFGFKTNSLPFVMLANRLSLSLVKKEAHDLFRLEALLFGTAGLLDDVFEDEYPRLLQNEFEFMRIKYQLIPLNKSVWKFLRMRPANFPTLRIAQLAAVLHHHHNFYSTLLFEEVNQIQKSMTCTVSNYWHNHYSFVSKSPQSFAKLGDHSAVSILINAICPFLIFLGELKQIQSYKDKSLELLMSCPVEDNKISKLFTSARLKPLNALDTQAFLNLHSNYCTQKKCLNCAVGVELLKN